MSKIDSNITGMAYAEEQTIGVLPGSAKWYALLPNSYSDFGGEITTVASSPINPSRQDKKGTTTDLDASGGFNIDVKQNNLTRLLQGFFFADAREKFGTANFNGTAIPITNVDATGNDYEAASGLDGFSVGSLVLASGFTNSANNGLSVVSAALAGSLTVTGPTLVNETPGTDAVLKTVGFQFQSGELSLTANVDNVTLTATTTDTSTLGLNIGEWVVVGGDAAGNKFDNNDIGYGRIKSITATTIVLDETTFTPTTDAGTGKSIRLFSGTVIRNEKDPALIKRRTYQFERTLGDDSNGVQSEYLTGTVSNEITLNMPTADKFMADLGFLSLDNEQRDGLTGIKPGDRFNEDVGTIYNTSSDVFRIKMSVNDPAVLNPNALFGVVEEFNLTINNNLTVNKGIGIIGGFEVTAGNFVVGGDLTAYFSTVEAVQAVRNNADIGVNAILAHNNEGMVWDLPLQSLGNGRLNVEKDAAIKLPLEMNGAENENGYTLMACFLPYVPDGAQN